jgi:hypothetical protein
MFLGTKVILIKTLNDKCKMRKSKIQQISALLIRLLGSVLEFDVNDMATTLKWQCWDDMVLK